MRIQHVGVLRKKDKSRRQCRAMYGVVYMYKGPRHSLQLYFQYTTRGKGRGMRRGTRRYMIWNWFFSGLCLILLWNFGFDCFLFTFEILHHIVFLGGKSGSFGEHFICDTSTCIGII